MMTSKTKKILYGAIIPLLAGAGCLIVFLLFPHVLNHQTLFGLSYFKVGDQERIITVSQETGNNDDGTYLAGYMVKLLDPATHKELDQLFIKRSHPYSIPASPRVVLSEQQELWLIQVPEFVQGDTGYVCIIKIENDKLVRINAAFMHGWTFQWIGAKGAGLVNQYNEPGCLDFSSHSIVDSACVYDQFNQPQRNSRFFFVKNTSGSNRSHLYYYRCDTVFPPAGIFAGTLEEGQTIPGWHLMDAISMGYGSLNKEELDAYSKNFTSRETLIPLYNKELLVSPYLVYESETECLVLAGEQDSKEFWYFQSEEGALKWKYPCPAGKNNPGLNDYQCREESKNMVITDNHNWIISLDKANGKLHWKYPK
jgi:hypothetical protein